MKFWPDSHNLGSNVPDEFLYLSLNPVTLIKGKFIWTVLTYMFVHGSGMHILFNMLGLLVFGPPLEQRIGSWEFLTYYLVTGLLTGLFSVFLAFLFGWTGMLLMGASGAIYALLLAFAVFYPRARIFIWGIIPVKAPILVLIFAGMALVQQLTGLNSNVAHFAHLAGLGFGYLYIVVRMGINPVRVFKESRKNTDHFS
jgi:membrane associated rhomboid family serine protease